MAEAKMSIVESRSDAHTLMEPVMTPVAILRTIKNPAASMESRAAELFAAASDWIETLPAAIAIQDKYTSRKANDELKTTGFLFIPQSSSFRISPVSGSGLRGALRLLRRG